MTNVLDATGCGGGYKGRGLADQRDSADKVWIQLPISGEFSMTSWWRRALGIVAALSCAACGAGEALVSSACRAAELEIEVLAGEEGDGFIALAGVAVGTDGTAYLLDSGEGSLIAFAPEGDEIWRVRGRDTGSSDFDEPGWLHRVDTLLVFEDLAGGRLSFWTERGERAGSLALDSLELPGRVAWVGAVGRDAVAAVVEGEDDEGYLPPELALVLAVAGYGVVDTLAVMTPPAPQVLYVGDHALPVDPPYAAYPSFVVSPEGLIAVARGDEYRVEIFDATGAPYAEIRGAGAAPAVTRADRRAFGRLLPDTLLVEQLAFPETHPAITALAATADGHILVRTSWARGDQVRWDRWTQTGEFVDSFVLPNALLPVTGVGNLIYGRATDEVGAHHLAVYNLAGPSTCPGPPALSGAGEARGKP